MTVLTQNLYNTLQYLVRSINRLLLSVGLENAEQDFSIWINIRYIQAFAKGVHTVLTENICATPVSLYSATWQSFKYNVSSDIPVVVVKTVQLNPTQEKELMPLH